MCRVKRIFWCSQHKSTFGNLNLITICVFYCRLNLFKIKFNNKKFFTIKEIWRNVKSFFKKRIFFSNKNGDSEINSWMMSMRITTPCQTRISGLDFPSFIRHHFVNYANFRFPLSISTITMMMRFILPAKILLPTRGWKFRRGLNDSKMFPTLYSIALISDCYIVTIDCCGSSRWHISEGGFFLHDFHEARGDRYDNKCDFNRKQFMNMKQSMMRCGLLHKSSFVFPV